MLDLKRKCKAEKRALRRLRRYGRRNSRARATHGSTILMSI
ncbi:MAG: hypothetical protein V3R20_01095 [Sphingomonadales bacterium]